MRNSIENYIIDNIANFAGSRISEEEKKAKIAKKRNLDVFTILKQANEEKGYV